MKRFIIASFIASCLCAQSLPRLIRFSGTARDAPAVTGITFSLYGDQSGGAPLWSETQNVQVDRNGRYAVLLGVTHPEGLPAALFTAEQAHWVGVSVEGQPEQPRILLVSAPYALKAGDAETLGGLPPSAFLLAAPPAARAESPSGAAPSTAAPLSTGPGTANYIPLWTDSTGDLGNSAIFQSGTANRPRVGINTTTPASALDVEGGATVRGALNLPSTGKATAAAGFNSQPIDFTASAFNSLTSTTVPQTFQWQAEPTGNDTTAAAASLNLLFGPGTSTPAETGLSIGGNGLIAFAAGQTFPGTGAITGVTAGTDLTGGGSAGNVTLGLDTTKVPQLAANNAFTGTVSAASFSGDGAGITNVNAKSLGGSPSAAYAQLAANNTFSGQQTMTGSSSAGVLQVTNMATAGVAPAIVGTTNSNAANAIKGIVTATSGTDAGVFGTTSSRSGFGVMGQGPVVGVYGTSHGSSQLCAPRNCATGGVWGDTSAQGGTGVAGVLGTADSSSAGWFNNNSQVAATLYVYNSFTTNPQAQVLLAEGYGGACVVFANGNLRCTGTITSTADVQGKQVSLFASQSTGNWLEDTGAGQLSSGSARIVLDPTFAQAANTRVDYHVFLTPQGDCEGLYVTGKTAQGFEVHELRGGRSDVAFEYRIMAKRTGFETDRLTDVTKRSLR